MGQGHHAALTVGVAEAVGVRPETVVINETDMLEARTSIANPGMLSTLGTLPFPVDQDGCVQGRRSSRRVGKTVVRTNLLFVYRKDRSRDVIPRLGPTGSPARPAACRADWIRHPGLA